MYIPGYKSAKRGLRWVKNRIFPGALILGYHRISHAQHDTFGNFVSPENFYQQMEVLRLYANPTSLPSLTTQLKERNPSPRTVSVTIDDGYVDALEIAKIILEKHNVPATIFVTSGYLGTEFWWDKLDRYLRNKTTKNNRLVIKINERIHEWEIGSQGIDLENAIISIANILRPLNVDSRDNLLEEIKKWSGNPSYHENEARCMTAEELFLLGENHLIEIGSHSISHPLLTELSFSDRQHEIMESKRVLEEITSKPVSGFSFPNGRFSNSDIELVRQSGYHYACTSMNGTIRQESNLYTLPRFWVGDVDGDRFYKWLKLWM